MHENTITSIYKKTYPLSLAIELSIQFLSLLCVVFLFLDQFRSGNPYRIAVALLIGVYLYPLFIALLSSMFTFIFPKPKTGNLESKGEIFKYAVLTNLMMFVRRSPAQWLVFIFPFPGFIFYRLCGARVSPFITLVSADSVPDPFFVSIGKGSVIGHGALISGHWRPRDDRLRLGHVEIGKHVVVGVSATIWPDVVIGDESVIQEKSVVLPGTRIPPREVWGGFPAQKIKSRS